MLIYFTISFIFFILFLQMIMWKMDKHDFMILLGFSLLWPSTLIFILLHRDLREDFFTDCLLSLRNNYRLLIGKTLRLGKVYIRMQGFAQVDEYGNKHDHYYNMTENFTVFKPIIIREL